MKSSGEKFVINRLNSYSSQEANHFNVQRQVYFEAMTNIIVVVEEHINQAQSLSIDKIKGETDNLGSKRNMVDQLLDDVKKSIEYEV